MSCKVGEISIRAFEGEVSRLKRGMAMTSMVDWAIGRRVSIMYGLKAIVFNSMAWVRTETSRAIGLYWIVISI